MINPNLLKTAVKKERDPRFAGGKFYLPVLHGNGYARAARRIFKRASEAETYAARLHARWVRLYEGWGRMVEAAMWFMEAELAERRNEPSVPAPAEVEA